jgi:hypothetical protein
MLNISRSTALLLLLAFVFVLIVITAMLVWLSVKIAPLAAAATGSMWFGSMWIGSM